MRRAWWAFCLVVLSINCISSRLTSHISHEYNEKCGTDWPLARWPLPIRTSWRTHRWPRCFKLRHSVILFALPRQIYTVSTGDDLLPRITWATSSRTVWPSSQVGHMKRARHVDPLLVWCWATVAGGGPTSNRQWANVLWVSWHKLTY